MMRKNKKGSTADNFYAVAVIFGLAVFFLVVSVFWTSITDQQMVDNIWSKTTVGTNAQNRGQAVYDNLDNYFMLVYIGLHLGILVLAYFLRVLPVVFVGFVLLSIILTVIAAPLSNAYEQIIQDTTFATAAASTPMMNNVLALFPLYEFLWGIITGILMIGTGREL